MNETKHGQITPEQRTQWERDHRHEPKLSIPRGPVDELDLHAARRIAQVCFDMHDALGVQWGSDPYRRIKALVTSPWIKTSERAPTEKDADERGEVFAIVKGFAGTWLWRYVKESPEIYPYWMPIPALPCIAYVEALERDRERLNWLQSQIFVCESAKNPHLIRVQIEERIEHDDIRCAIDVARRLSPDVAASTLSRENKEPVLPALPKE